MSVFKDMSKDEYVEFRRVVQEIELFLRMADVRINTHPEALPFKATSGHLVVSWLRALADRYARGDNIMD